MDALEELYDIEDDQQPGLHGIGYFAGDLANMAQAVQAPPPPPLSPAPSAAFLGDCPAMREAAAIVKAASRSNAPVLILGETGSGKEVVARQLHNLSTRAQQAFVKLNCAALPSELVESELFGYERGAFTGAFQRKIGMFELADKGTIMLDEIGDMDVRLQAKLLQVLQDKEFKRLGGRETIRVDVRVIAATHRDLEKAITDGSFREDLFYRLNVVAINLPPLRERGADILRLADLLMDKHGAGSANAPQLTDTIRRAMLAYDWPGNVRELENIVQRYLLFADPVPILRALVPKRNRKPDTTATTPAALQPSAAIIPPTLEEVASARNKAESQAILSALSATRWNRKRAARMLNIDYKALLYRMKKLGLEQPGQ